MSAPENVDFIELPEVPADVLREMESLLNGPEAALFSPLPISATNQSAHGVNTLKQCASVAIFAMMSSFTNSTGGKGASEKQDN